jgi:general secretion pathway protein I
MKQKYHYKNAKGFTLIETLTAMMILSVCLVTILQLFSGGLKSGRISDEYTKAIFHAKSEMGKILIHDMLKDMELGGSFEDGFKWKAVITGLESEDDEDKSSKLPFKLFHISVTVSWKDGIKERKFTVNTVHAAGEIKPDKKNG